MTCINKCYTIENIVFDKLCSECKTIINDTLNNCSIIKDGHNVSNIIINDVLITHNDYKIKVERIKIEMNLEDIREIDFGSRDNNNFVIIMICKKIININDIWKQINKQLLNKLFSS